jgi:hypothetical protein
MSSFLRLAGPSFVSSHSPCQHNDGSSHRQHYYWILSERELSGGIEIDHEESIDDDDDYESDNI